MEYGPWLWVFFVIGTWKSPVEAMKRFLCDNLGPLSCENGGVLYIQSVYCRPYGYAMQLLQEMCSGRSRCLRDVMSETLKPRCCRTANQQPHIVYSCVSSDGRTLEESPVAGEVSENSVQSDSWTHTINDQMLIVAVCCATIFLWGVGLLFFYLRYNDKSNHCVWLRSRPREKPRHFDEVTEDNPVYMAPDDEEESRYVEIQCTSTHVYNNIPLYTVHPFPTISSRC